MFVRSPRFAGTVLFVMASAFGVSSAAAQTGPKPAAKTTTPDGAKPKPKYNPYGSPLDTIMSTRLWTDVPPPQDFVKKTHPDVSKLEYTPMTGYTGTKEPVRPKPRDPANIQALQAELEQDLAHNRKKALGLGGAMAPAPKHARKAAAKPRTTAAR